MKIQLLTLAILLAGVSTNAQAPELVEDLVAGPDKPMKNPPMPGGFTLFLDKLYFNATDSANNGCFYEWRQMGTKARRITPAHPQNPPYRTGLLQRPFKVFDSKMIYRVNYGQEPRMLAFDGANPPTALLTVTSSDSTYWGGAFELIGNNIYYLGGRQDSLNTTYGRIRPYLYSYDGVNKPVLITRTCEDNGVSNSTVVYNNKLYFIKDSTGYGKELFSYDPATKSVGLAADVVPGPKDGNILELTTGGGLLLFDASDSAHGRELYSYNGIAASRRTSRVGKADGLDSNSNLTPVHFKGGVFFVGKDTTPAKRLHLYRYDIAADTVGLIHNSAADTLGGHIWQWCVGSYKLYFICGTAQTGYEVWSYERGDSVYTMDYNPGTANGVGATSNMIYYRGYVYYCGNSAATGYELYRMKDTIGRASMEVQSLSWDGQAMIYPNPAKEKATVSITIAAAQKLSVSLSDGSGRRVFSTGVKELSAGRNNIAITLSGLAAGGYFYRVENGIGLRVAGGALVIK